MLIKVNQETHVNILHVTKVLQEGGVVRIFLTGDDMDGYGTILDESILSLEKFFISAC